MVARPAVAVRAGRACCRLARSSAALALGVLAAVLGAPDAASQTQPADPRPRYEFSWQLRARAETRLGTGENPAREDGLGLTRARLDATLRPSGAVRFFVQVQDARVLGLAPGRGRRGVEDPVDFRQAYVALGPEGGSLELFLGRKQLMFLDERLLGARRWSNTSPTFDGAQLSIRRGEHSVHLLGFSQVRIEDGFNPTARRRFLYGAIGSIKLAGGNHLLEPLVLASRREDSTSANIGGLLTTAGGRLSGEFSDTWDYQVILAAQGGGRPERPQRAWMGVWALGKTLEGTPGRPRLGVEWSQASGDDDPSDRRTGTFDTLFPAPHRILGEMDLVALRNLRFLKGGVELSPRKDLKVNVDVIDLHLDSPRDGLYGLNMRPAVRPPKAGAASSSIGKELDFVVRYYPKPSVELRFGASRFFAGPFVRDAEDPGESQTFLTTSLLISF